jgi:hypothetical protein
MIWNLSCGERQVCIKNESMAYLEKQIIYFLFNSVRSKSVSWATTRTGKRGPVVHTYAGYIPAVLCDYCMKLIKLEYGGVVVEVCPSVWICQLHN